MPRSRADLALPTAIRRALSNCSDTQVAIFGGVALGEVSLMSAGHPLTVRAELVAPHEGLSRQSAASSELPFGLGRPALARPLGIGDCIFVCDMHDRIVIFSFNTAVGSQGQFNDHF